MLLKYGITSAPHVIMLATSQRLRVHTPFRIFQLIALPGLQQLFSLSPHPRHKTLAQEMAQLPTRLE